MRIVVVGAGGMGCLYGALLARSGSVVSCVDVQPEVVAAIAAKGVLLETEEGESRVDGIAASSDFSPVRDADLVLFFVKSTATRAAAAACAPFLPSGALALTLQNGLGNVEALCEHIPAGQVVAGTSGVGATLLAPGRVRMAGMGETVLGAVGDVSAFRLEALAALFGAAGLPCRVSGDITGILWTKLLANVGINAIAALTGVRNGEVFTFPEGASLAEKAVREAAAVAEGEGVRLETSDPVAHVRAVAAKTAMNRASMLQDVLAGRRTEVDAINGEIVRRGARLGIPTPVNEALLSLVLLRERRKDVCSDGVQVPL